MKKILLILLSVLLLTGCGKKKVSLNDEEFYNIMSENKFQVYDDKENFPYAEHAYVIAEENLKVVFIEGKRKVDVEGVYVDQCNNVYKQALEGYDDTKKSGSNWSTLKLTDANNYYYVSLVDNTYLYIEGSLDKEVRINRIIDLLKY